MTAKELRIGNLAQDQNGNILKCCELNKISCGFEVIDRSKFPLPFGWKAEPIPLTEEWLVRAGFEKAIDSNLWVNDSYYQLTFNSQIGASLYEDEYWIKSNIIYLHSLQNLYFALTGEELNFANVK